MKKEENVQLGWGTTREWGKGKEGRNGNKGFLNEEGKRD